MAAGSLRRRLEQIPISNDYGLEVACVIPRAAGSTNSTDRYEQDH